MSALEMLAVILVAGLFTVSVVGIAVYALTRRSV